MTNQTSIYQTGELIVSKCKDEILIKLSKNKKFPNITQYLVRNFYNNKIQLISMY